MELSATLVIVVLTSITSLACFQMPQLFDALKHHPVTEYKSKQYYRWLTSGFVHGDFIHLFVNMFVFHEFGRTVEDYFIFHFGSTTGVILFVVSYFMMIIMADIPTYYKHKENYYFASVGASGGVAGILFFYILLFPWNLLYLFAIIPIPAILFGVLYLWYSTWASKKQNDMIDHEAHFFGALAGVALAIVTRPAILIEFFNSLMNDFPF